MHDTTLSTRRAAAPPRTLDLEARTVTVVAATAAMVARDGFRPDGAFGPWYETLTPAGCDLARLIGGPALRDHVALTTSTIGVIESAQWQGRELVADIRFGTGQDADAALRDVDDRVLRAVSIGYRVLEWKPDGRADDGAPIFKAMRWQPLEVSFVAIPADPAAKVRGAGEAAIARTTSLEIPMTAHPTTEAPATTTTPDLSRMTQIDNVMDAASRLVPEAARTALRAEAIANGLTVDQVRLRAFDLAAEACRGGADAPAISPAQSVRMGASGDDPAALREALAEALACRAGGRAPSPQARPHMSLRITDMQAMLLEARGVRTRGLGASQIATRAHSTSDFPALLQSTASRLLLEAFQPAASGVRMLSRPRTANDFRALSAIRFAGLARLEEVKEGGPVTHGTAFENEQSYRVRTFARAVALTRQAIVNDDLGAFDSMRVVGQAAAATEAAEFVALLTANGGTGPIMADGTALYATSRGNTVSPGAAIDITSLSAGRTAMRTQRDLNAEVVENSPRYLLVPPALETTAKQYVAPIAATASAAVNPFAGELEPIVEARLTGNAWYLFADPVQQPVFEMATLAATGGVPQIEVFTEAGTLGITLRVVHDFGIGAVGWLGTWRNPGA